MPEMRSPIPSISDVEFIGQLLCVHLRTSCSYGTLSSLKRFLGDLN